MNMINPENMFLIGEIVNTHGVKGEVRIKQITDFIERFDEGSTVYLKDKSNELIPLTIEMSRLHKNLLLVRFEQYQTHDEVEQLKGLTLHITKEQQTELGSNEFYYHEIIGCTVHSTEDEVIGVVDHILAPGANDVWVVKNDAGKEYLIPYIADVVKEVDVENKRIIIEIMEGLLD